MKRFAVLAVAVCALAACGGGDDTSPDPPEMWRTVCDWFDQGMSPDDAIDKFAATARGINIAYPDELARAAVRTARSDCD